MTVAMYAIGVLIMLLGIGASIALHEIGHLVPAKRFGVKVPRYMIGFGPTLWSRRRGETEYGVKAIPLGGYIQMIGMFPPKPGQPEGTVRVSSTGRFSQLMDEARETSLAEVGPGDEDRVFYKLPTLKKLTVMLGGPLMNALIATVLFTGLLTLYGKTEATTTVASVSECVSVQRAADLTPETCTADTPVAPAKAAGLKPGDVIRSVNGAAVDSWDDIRAAIRGGLDRPMTLVVERAGRDVTLNAHPLVLELPVYDKATYAPTKDSDGNIITERAGFLGASPTSATVRQPLTAVPGELWRMTEATAEVILRLPQKMVGIYQAAFSGEERDPNGPISVVGVGRVAGEVTAIEEVHWQDKLAMLISLIAGLNIALFVFNLIPLLPLDGGHAAGATWEAVKRGWARLRGRPDPGYVDVAKALPLAYAVSIGLIGMTVLLIYADLVNPVRLGG
ncbi:MAG: site-2 protease family protein [Micrococcales bacterium]|nr:site-2 protease family protein [Micrococcales bacterium]